MIKLLVYLSAILSSIFWLSQFTICVINNTTFLYDILINRAVADMVYVIGTKHKSIRDFIPCYK